MTGKVELAVALKVKLADRAFLLGIALKVIVWSERGVAVTIQS